MSDSNAPTEVREPLFEYVPVPDELSGGAALDLTLTEGMYVRGVGRCCENCSLLRCEVRLGIGRVTHLFSTAELRPLNDGAVAMLKTVKP